MEYRHMKYSGYRNSAALTKHSSASCGSSQPLRIAEEPYLPQARFFTVHNLYILQVNQQGLTLIILLSIYEGAASQAAAYFFQM